jgi:hypothetical protein
MAKNMTTSKLCFDMIEEVDLMEKNNTKKWNDVESFVKLFQWFTSWNELLLGGGTQQFARYSLQHVSKLVGAGTMLVL